jgi:hypothetical protein
MSLKQQLDQHHAPLRKSNAMWLMSSIVMISSRRDSEGQRHVLTQKCIASLMVEERTSSMLSLSYLDRVLM